MSEKQEQKGRRKADFVPKNKYNFILRAHRMFRGKKIAAVIGRCSIGNRCALLDRRAENASSALNTAASQGNEFRNATITTFSVELTKRHDH